MTLLSSVQQSLRLLSRRDQRLLVLSTVIQVATSVLDLLGVLLIGIVAGLAMANLTGSATPSTFTSILGRVGISSLSGGTALWLAGVAGVLLLGKTAVSVFLTRRQLRFLARRQALVSGVLIERLLASPLIEVQQRSSQETAFALTAGVQYAILIVLGQAVVALAEGALLLVIGVGLFVVDPWLTIFSIIFFALVGLAIYRLLSRWAVRLGGSASVLDIDSLATIQEALSSYRELWVGGRRNSYVEKVQVIRWRSAGVSADLQFIGLFPKYVFECALVIGGGLLVVSQLFTKSGAAAIAVIALYLAAGSRVVPSLLRMQGAILSVRSAGSSAEPTYRLAHDLFPDGPNASFGVESPAAGMPPSAIGSGYAGFDASVHVEDVSFSYPGSAEPAVDHATFSVASGQSLALVGTTGAGKSTLADLILGVLEPASGRIHLSGMTPELAIAAFPGAIAYVPQMISLVNGTIRDNVALGWKRDEIDDDLVWDALRRAHLETFIKDAREGLDTEIGERGIRLSGGQRQRVGIARALYTRPKLVILDEATSALDAETENSIGETIQALEGEVTTVTVAHRLATIRHCDLVLYLEGGRIVAQGTFDEVRQQSERFDAQARLLGMA